MKRFSLIWRTYSTKYPLERASVFSITTTHLRNYVASPKNFQSCRAAQGPSLYPAVTWPEPAARWFSIPAGQNPEIHGNRWPRPCPCPMPRTSARCPARDQAVAGRAAWRPARKPAWAWRQGLGVNGRCRTVHPNADIASKGKAGSRRLFLFQLCAVTRSSGRSAGRRTRSRRLRRPAC